MYSQTASLLKQHFHHIQCTNSPRHMAAWNLLGSRARPCFAGRAVQGAGTVHGRNRARRPCTVVAYSVRDKIHDWRVAQMIEISNSYFQNLWSQVAECASCVDLCLNNSLLCFGAVWHTCMADTS